jgi:hypothetical protein
MRRVALTRSKFLLVLHAMAIAPTRQLFARFQGLELPGSDADIKAYFKGLHCGRIDPKLLVNRDSAYITFQSVKDARTGLEKANRKAINGTEIRLSWSRPSRIVKLLIPNTIDNAEAQTHREKKLEGFRVEVEFSEVAGQKSATLRFETPEEAVKFVNQYQEFKAVAGWLWMMEFLRVCFLKIIQSCYSTLYHSFRVYH